MKGACNDNDDDLNEVLIMDMKVSNKQAAMMALRTSVVFFVALEPTTQWSELAVGAALLKSISLHSREVREYSLSWISNWSGLQVGAAA